MFFAVLYLPNGETRRRGVFSSHDAALAHVTNVLADFNLDLGSPESDWQVQEWGWVTDDDV